MKQTTSGDPEYGVFKVIAGQLNAIAAMPTWEEILEVEYIRESGRVNMLTDNVTRHAFDLGLHGAVEWLERCREARIAPWTAYEIAAKDFARVHGPRCEWLTQDTKDEFELREITIMDLTLKQKIRELKAQRKALSAKKSTGL